MQICAGKDRKMLMAIELPRDLGVTNLREIQILNAWPRLEWRGHAVNDVSVPTDVISIVKILISEQVKAVAANLIRIGDEFRSFRWKIRSDRSDAARYFARMKEKVRRRS